MLITIIIIQLIGVAIASLVTAIFLRAAAKWVQKMDVSYGNAYVTTLFAGAVNAILGSVLGFAIGARSQSPDAANGAALLMIPVCFLVQSGFISSRLKIPFGRACLVSFTMIAIGVAILLVVAIPVIIIATLGK